MSGSTSASAVHDTLPTEHEALFTSSVAGPSQPIVSRSNTSAVEPTMADDTFAAEHDVFQFLSTSSSAAGLIHPTFDLSGSTSTEFATVDDPLVTGYKASEFFDTLSGFPQPTIDLNAGTSVGEFATVGDILVAGDEGSQFLLGSSQSTFDLSAGTSVGEFDHTLVAGWEASQFLSSSDPSQSTFDLGASISTAEFDALVAGYELFLFTLSGPVDPSQPIFDLDAGTSAVAFTGADNTLTTGYEASPFSSTTFCPSQPIFDLNAGVPVGEFGTVDDTSLQFLSALSDPTDPAQPTFDLGAGTFATESTTVDNTWVTGYEASQILPALPGPSEPIFDLGSTTDELTAKLDEKLAAELDDELAAELNALLFPSAPSGDTNEVASSKNGPRRRRRAKGSSRKMLANKSSLSSYPSFQREPNLTAASSGSDSQPSMVAFNPFVPGDRAIGISDAPAMGSYEFSFKFDGSALAGSFNAPQPSTSVPGTIGGTLNSFNDAGTSNFFGGEMIGANKQATQTSQPLFDFEMTGGQSISMDNTTQEDSVLPVFGMGDGSSAVDTMQPTSSSLFNALG